MVRIKEVNNEERGARMSVCVCVCVCVCVYVKGYNMEVAGKVTFES